MAEGKTLTWRKFPRDTITSPALRFIAKRLPKEQRHQVFTLFTALYCSADDGGIVDLNDLDVFADICMMDITNLEDLLYQFLERNVIEEIDIDGLLLYKITSWIDPYPLRMSNAERQREYRERKREQKSFSGFSRKKTEEAAPRAGGDDFYEKLANMTVEEINRFLLEGESGGGAAEGNTIDSTCGTAASVSSETEFSPADGKILSVTRKITQCNAQNSRVTQRYSVTPKIEEIDRKEEKKERREETDRGEREETEEREIEMRGEDIERERKGDERENRQTEERERKRKRKEKIENTQKEEERTAQNGGPEIQGEEAEEEKKQMREPPPSQEKIRRCFGVLWKFFEKYNPMGYADDEGERIACMQLAIRMTKLENKKNSAEIIASQFANRFFRLLKTGGYYENMPCTPQLLLKKGNYSKVFGMVAKILHPQDAGGEHWAAELQKAIQNNKDDV